MGWVMKYSLLQRLNFDRYLTSLQSIPIIQEFSLVQLCPSFHEPLLPSWKPPGNQGYGINAVNGLSILVVSVKVWQVVLRCWFGKHPNDDPKEAAEFRHV
jgi:hypothetical protein